MDRGVVRLREAAAADPLADDPAAKLAAFLEGTAALRRGDLAAAIAALQAAVKAVPASSEAHRLLGTVFWLKADTKQSERHFEAALRLRQDDERSWIALAALRAETATTLDVLATLDAALKVVSRSGELRSRRAALLVSVDRADEALDAYAAAEVGAIVEGRARIVQSIAALAMRQQQFAVADDALERRVRLRPNDVEAHRELAAGHTRNGRHDDALAELAIAAWLDPGDALTFAALGQHHLSQQRDADAIAALERALASVLSRWRRSSVRRTTRWPRR
jgi:tetratricopeptide (TPR) repeat protein